MLAHRCTMVYAMLHVLLLPQMVKQHMYIDHNYAHRRPEHDAHEKTQCHGFIMGSGWCQVDLSRPRKQSNWQPHGWPLK